MKTDSVEKVQISNSKQTFFVMLFRYLSPPSNTRQRHWRLIRKLANQR